MITIGEQKLNTTTPKDLDTAFVAVNGCSAAETLALLPDAVIASVVAQALTPFLQSPPDLPDLADMIDAAGMESVKADVIKLFPGEIEPAPMTPVDPPAADPPAADPPAPEADPAP